MKPYTAVFNLLPYVQKKRVLSSRWILVILGIYAGILLLISVATYVRDVQLKNATAELGQTMAQSVSMLRDSLTQQEKTLVAILPPSSLRLNQQGFYPAFADLSSLQMDNLWLTRFIIDRREPLIRFEGMMRSSNMLNDFLAFLAESPTFKRESFVGLAVQEATLPTIPDEYKAKIEALTLPTFYRFIAQTTVLTAEKTS